MDLGGHECFSDEPSPLFFEDFTTESALSSGDEEEEEESNGLESAGTILFKALRKRYAKYGLEHLHFSSNYYQMILTLRGALILFETYDRDLLMDIEKLSDLTREEKTSSNLFKIMDLSNRINMTSKRIMPQGKSILLGRMYRIISPLGPSELKDFYNHLRHFKLYNFFRCPEHFVFMLDDMFYIFTDEGEVVRMSYSEDALFVNGEELIGGCKVNPHFNFENAQITRPNSNESKYVFIDTFVALWGKINFRANHFREQIKNDVNYFIMISLPSFKSKYPHLSEPNLVREILKMWKWLPSEKREAIFDKMKKENERLSNEAVKAEILLVRGLQQTLPADEESFKKRKREIEQEYLHHKNRKIEEADILEEFE